MFERWRPRAYRSAGRTGAGYVRAYPLDARGKLRPLAVTSATRSAALPDVSTASEFVPGYEATAWFG
ncbi:MAG: tripartite tricarboxylate transporter substrate-binding protein, partial [Xanthobacteraceae bacterium]